MTACQEILENRDSNRENEKSRFENERQTDIEKTKSWRRSNSFEKDSPFSLIETEKKGTAKKKKFSRQCFCVNCPISTFLSSACQLPVFS